MLNVYNYYMQDYVSRSPRYSTHKKRELHDIYKNIVKMSASEPLYKIELSESRQAAALSIKEAALSLMDVSHRLQNTPLLHTAGLHSSLPEAVDATLLHRMDFDDFEKETAYGVEVFSLAGGQKNVGALLSSEEAPLPEGNYSFTISLGQDSYSFRFQVAAGSKAFELQSKLSDFINKTGIGLNAQVSFNKELHISRMELSAQQTGSLEKSTFSLADTSMPKAAENGIVEVFGLNHETVPAQNAQYAINGVRFEAPENTVLLDDTIQLTLHSVTDAPVTIRPVADRNAVYEAFEEFTISYNRLIKAGKDAVSENKSSAFLLRGLSHLVAVHYSSLSAIGVTADEEGYLSLDFAAAEKAALRGDADSAFRDGSFLQTLNSRLESIVLNPMRYVDKKLVAYPDPSAPLSERTSPYTTSIYSGMLFNNYC